MSKIVIKDRKLIKILLSIGFEIIRRRGSHIILKHEDGRTTVVPYHNETLGRGVLGEILKQIKITKNEFRKYL